MVWYFFIVAIVNLGAGVSLAMYANRRRYALMQAEAKLRNPPDVEDENAGQSMEEYDTRGDETEETPAVESPCEGAEPPQPDEPSEPEAPAPATASEETIAALLDDVEAGLAGTSDAVQSSAGAAVKDLKDQVRQFHDKLAEHDAQLRHEATGQSPKNVESCLKALGKTNNDHLATLQRAKSSLTRAGEDSDEFRNLLDDLFASVEKQIEQVRQANEVVEQFDYQGNLGDGCRQMVDVTTKLLNANYRIRDSVDDALAELARREGRLGSADSLARVDALTGVIDRTGLEAHLRQLWEDDPQRQKRLAVGMLDLDNFGKVNEQFGQATGDRILRAFADMLQAESGRETKVARMAGQRFAIVIPEADLGLAIHQMERIRQTAEAMKYKTADQEIQVTVSCAVMEVGSDDTSDSLFARCDTTIQEAKRFGRNRTFSHEGEYPKAVTPSNLAPREQLVSV